MLRLKNLLQPIVSSVRLETVQVVLALGTKMNADGWLEKLTFNIPLLLIEILLFVSLLL